MVSRPIPTPSLVVLVGPPASGKSTWASEHFRPEQIVSADALRGIVGEHELDLVAADAHRAMAAGENVGKIVLAVDRP